MKPTRHLALFALALLFSCSSAQTRRSAVPASAGGGASLPALSEKDVAKVLELVSGARGMVIDRDVDVRRLGPDDFRREVEKRVRSIEEATDAFSEEAFLAGFDFVPPPRERGGVSTESELVVEQVAAFYDKKEDRIYVPLVHPKSHDEALLQRAVLAHEIQHALQAQRFGHGGEVTSTDHALARLALIEGDAMVAMGAYLGAEQGAPIGRTLRRIREATESVPRSALAHEEEKGSALARSTELARVRLAFPYEEGMFFVSDLYRAGGFALVDEAFSHVPTTTEQILHPEKYLAGEGARPIRALDIPAGLALIGDDVMGELQTRVLLERCAEKERARRAAEGWGGDRVFVLSAGDRSLGVAWITAWDTEADAREFEAALAGAKSCFTENAAQDHSVGATFAVQRRGDAVAFVRGFTDKGAKLFLPKLLDLPGKPQKKKAVSHAVIPARVALPEPEKGTLDGDVYENPWIGLVGRIPEGMRADITDEHLELLIDRPDAPISGALAISTRITSDEQNERTFGEVRDAFSQAIGKHGLTLRELGGGATKTALGSAIERTWEVEGTPVRVRVTMIPICAGTGSVVFVLGYGDGFAERVLDGWMESFRFTDGRNMKACDFLDPK